MLPKVLPGCEVMCKKGNGVVKIELYTYPPLQESDTALVPTGDYGNQGKSCWISATSVPALSGHIVADRILYFGVTRMDV